MADETPTDRLRQINLHALNAHVRFEISVQHAQERLARDLRQIGSMAGPRFATHSTGETTMLKRARLKVSDWLESLARLIRGGGGGGPMEPL